MSESEQIKNLIQQEIDWCKAHPMAGNENWEDGYLRGLTQATSLINKYELNKINLSDI